MCIFRRYETIHLCGNNILLKVINQNVNAKFNKRIRYHYLLRICGEQMCEIQYLNSSEAQLLMLVLSKNNGQYRCMSLFKACL